MKKPPDKALMRGDNVEQDLSSSTEASGMPNEVRQSADGTRRRRHGEPPHGQKEWYSKSEAALYLGVAEITITRYLVRGILPTRRLPTPGRKAMQSGYDYGRLRIHKSALDRYLESADRHPDHAQASLTEATSNESSTEGNSGSTATMGDEQDWEHELTRLLGAREAARDAAKASKRSRGGKGVTTKEKQEAERCEAELSEFSEPLQRAGLILTREEAALQLGVSWRTIDRYIKSGILRFAGYLRCPDSYARVHILRSDVEQLLQFHEVSSYIEDQHDPNSV